MSCSFVDRPEEAEHIGGTAAAYQLFRCKCIQFHDRGTPIPGHEPRGIGFDVLGELEHREHVADGMARKRIGVQAYAQPPTWPGYLAGYFVRLGRHPNHLSISRLAQSSQNTSGTIVVSCARLSHLLATDHGGCGATKPFK